jgi:hypothetical protein
MKCRFRIYWIRNCYGWSRSLNTNECARLNAPPKLVNLLRTWHVRHPPASFGPQRMRKCTEYYKKTATFRTEFILKVLVFTYHFVNFERIFTMVSNVMSLRGQNLPRISVQIPHNVVGVVMVGVVVMVIIIIIIRSLSTTSLKTLCQVIRSNVMQKSILYGVRVGKRC